MKLKKYFVIFILLILVLILICKLFSFCNAQTDKTIVDINPPTISSPSPIPFQQLTIPYLREKKYQSSLSQLELISENDNYFSYLASYDSDGLKINGLLTVPKGEAPTGGWPAIVFVHGYIPPKSYKTTERYSDYVDYLAKNNFVVFKIDLRGHDQSDGKAEGAYFSSGYVIDTLNAYQALQNSSLINPDQVGLWGHSMAGNIVLRTQAVKQDIPAVVIWAGAVYTYQDMSELGINDQSYRPPTNEERSNDRERLFDTYGKYTNNDFWHQVAPTNYLSDIKGAIQIHHAIDDQVVNIEYSRNLDKLLQQANVTHQLLEYPTGGHNISEPSFSQAMEETVDFFHKNLQ